MTAELHPALAHVTGLLGTWSGDGAGEYPTIRRFRYLETITFGHVGKPFLAYGQRTVSPPDAPTPHLPMHAESGYWRFPAPGRIEMVLAHPTGIVEVEEGTIDVDPDGSIAIEVATTTIGLTRSAVPVQALARSFRIVGDVIEYSVRLAAVGLPLQHHLAGRLVRRPD